MFQIVCNTMTPFRSRIVGESFYHNFETAKAEAIKMTEHPSMANATLYVYEPGTGRSYRVNIIGTTMIDTIEPKKVVTITP